MRRPLIICDLAVHEAVAFVIVIVAFPLAVIIVQAWGVSP